MALKQLFERKSIETLLAEMHDEQRLHRVLGPLALTSLGVGAIIGSGIFVMTGQVAAEDAGPAVMISYVVAGIACVLAALCYSEFASMVPVAGSAYTYTYATLGELAAWIIGWDLVLEYGMSCAAVASSWTNYLNEFLIVTTGWKIPPQLMSDPFTKVEVAEGLVNGWVNLPAMGIIAVVTYVLVIGIRESAAANTLLVIVKLGVVLLVIGLGLGYVNSANYTEIPVEKRRMSVTRDFLSRHPRLAEALPPETVTASTTGEELLALVTALRAHSSSSPGGQRVLSDEQQAILANHPQLDFSKLRQPGVLPALSEPEEQELAAVRSETGKLGMIGLVGIKDRMSTIDNQVRSPFMPYGLSGIMIGAALVFYAYIGFDSISTHSEEAINPQRDVPIGILGSLGLCTLLYILVAAVITGMVPYPDIDTKAAVASAFRKQSELQKNPLLSWASGLISLGALAGMTSVLLVTFLSQARIFLAMARDGLLPKSIFSRIHEVYRTPHRSTLLTGGLIMLVAGFMPMRILGEMVSIGTLMAFALVCGSVLVLRVRHPELPRPFRCPFVWIVAPLGVLVNVLMMLFLPTDTWIRLVVWLALGLVFYFAYGFKNSTLKNRDNPKCLTPANQ